MLLFAERRGYRQVAVASASIALALIALLALAHRAQAAETLYWNNYSATPSTLGFSGITGSGGGTLNLAGVNEFESPEGMAYDSVTNRLFVADDSGGDGRIVAVNLDGSGASVFSAPGAPVEGPEGITVDPVGRLVYWINTNAETVSWARLDGSAGGLLNLAGGPPADGFRLALDPVGGRVYWGEQLETGDGRIAYANTNNTGGGILDISGATPPKFISAVAVDEVGRRVYWVDGTLERIQSASLNGGGGADVNVPNPPESAYGLNFDPSLGRLLWGNYVSGEEIKANQLGYGLLAGGGGAITVTSAPTYGVQDPVVIKSPAGTGLPALTRDAKNRSALSCSQGTWGGDYPGGFTYQAPRTYAYQWLRNGKPLAGATAATLTAISAGSYTCTVTAANQAGSATQTSAATTVKATKVKLTTKKKAKADAGDLVTFKVKAVNQGDLKPKSAKVCVKLPNAAKDDLKAPKCKKLGQLKGRAKKTVTIKVKVKPGADEGADKLTFQVKGAAGKAAKSKIIVK